MENQYKEWLNELKNQLFVIDMHQWMPKVPKRQKSQGQAEILRKQGNQTWTSCKSEEDFQKAYEYYAKSIAHARAKTRELALSYANLSAVLLRLEKHSECLEAIECCLNSDYPEESKFKLFLRKIECLKTINEPSKAKETYEKTLAWIETRDENKNDMKEKLENCYQTQVDVKLPYTNEEIDKIWRKFSIKSFNKEIPGASSGLSLKYNESQGRHFVAERDIKPGEILMKDRPYAVICAKSSQYKSCWQCCKSLKNCIPCDHCEHVIFCSEECKSEAWKEYHRVECQMLPFFFEIPHVGTNNHFTDFLIAAFRFLVFGIQEYGSIQKLREAFKEQRLSKHPRTKGFADGRLVVDKYMGFINLKSNSKYFDDSSLIFVTALMYRIATTTTLLGRNVDLDWRELGEDEDFVFATCAFLRHMDIVRANRTNDEKPFCWVGHTGTTCLSIPASLFNHSCVPNVFVVQTKKYIKVVCNRPIKTGEQVFLDYLGDPGCSKSERQKYLQTYFDLNCNCDACANDWPIAPDYPALDKLPASYTQILAFAQDVIKTNVLPVTNMNIKHDANIRRKYKFFGDNLTSISQAILKLDGNVPRPCWEFFTLQMFIYYFCSKLHTNYM